MLISYACEKHSISCRRVPRVLKIMYANQATKRRSRILNIQKKNLVLLVQNYFVRTIGRCSNVNFDEINLTQWGRIANILNSMGPPKSMEQWKNSFYFMTNRIRKKVEIVEQCGGNPRDNLTELDYKIYEMLPADNYVYDGVFDDPKSNENIEVTYNALGDSNISTTDEMDLDLGVNTVVINTPEELEAYMGEPVIEESFDYVHAGLENEDTGKDSQYSNTTIGHTPPDHTSIQKKRAQRTLSDTHHFVGTADELMGESREGIFHATISSPSTSGVCDAMQPTSTEASNSTSKITAKTGARIPEVQKERLVQLIQNNFLGAVGRFAGANGKFIKANLWQTFAKELNTLGPPRTAEQWKTTFNSIKAGAKAKLADDHNESTKTKNLSRLEEKIVSIYGMDNMDGHQSLGESGFRYARTVPQAHAQFAESSSGQSDTHIEDSTEEARHVTSHPEGNFASRTVGIFTSNKEGEFTSRAEGVSCSGPVSTVNLRTESAAHQPESSIFSPSPPHDDEVLRDLIDGIRNESNDMDDFSPGNERIHSQPPSQASSMLNGTNGAFSSERKLASRMGGNFTSRATGVSSRPGGVVGFRPQSSISYEDEVLRELLEEIRNEPDDRDEFLQSSKRNVLRASVMSNGTNGSGSLFPEREFAQSRPGGVVSFRPSQVVRSSPSLAESSSPGGVNSFRLGGVNSFRLGGVISPIEVVRSSSSKVVRSSPSKVVRSSHSKVVRSSPSLAVSSHPGGVNSSRLGGVISPIEVVRSSPFEVVRSSPSLAVNSRPGGVNSSRTEGVTSSTIRPQYSRPTKFAPPRMRRTIRSQSPQTEYISNVNQLFDDNGTDDECEFGQPSSGRRSTRNVDQSNDTVAKKARDRSNLRNKHTSHDMVLHSISSQERFIEDSNRNHAEMMFLNERNHSEMVGMFTATLSALVDVGQQFVNNM